MKGELIIFGVLVSFALVFAYQSIISKRGVEPKKLVLASVGMFLAFMCIVSAIGTDKTSPKKDTAPTVAVSTPAKQTSAPPATEPVSTAKRVTVDEFNARFLDELNLRAVTLGVQPADAMDEPERRVDGSYEFHTYPISKGAYMAEILAAGTNHLIGVNVVAANLEPESLFGAGLYFDCAVCAYDPTVDINTVHNAIGINYQSGDKPLTAKINGVTYEKKFIGSSSIAFKITR